MRLPLGAGPIRVVIIYGIAAGLWIILSDRALTLFTSDIAAMVTWSTYKGWFFVLVTGALLFLERRRAERAFRQSEMRFLRAVENFPDGFVLYDAERRFQFVNGNVLEAAATGGARMLGLRDEEIFPPEFTSTYLPALRRAMETRKIQIVECDVTIASRPTTLHVTYVPLVGEGDKVFQVMGIIRDITSQRKYEAQLRESLKEQETLLYEVHHRVKNNLQVVSSLLNLQAGEPGNREIAETLRESQNRIRSMALIHEKLYQAGTLSRINLGEYLRDLAARLSHSYGVDRAEIFFDLEEAVFSLDKAIPCGLIFNEIMSNALKHAFPDGGKGKVSIGLRHLGDAAYELSVADNGVGFPKGLDPARTTSLGMQLVHTLSNQLDGEVVVEQNGGTTVRVTFRTEDNP